jgi:hypothetical protein
VNLSCHTRISRTRKYLGIFFQIFFTSNFKDSAVYGRERSHFKPASLLLFGKCPPLNVF